MANIQQCFALFVIKTFGCKEELKNIYDQEWFIQAPYMIGICGIPEGNWIRMDGKNYNDVDSAISMDHLILLQQLLDLVPVGLAILIAVQHGNFSPSL
jgi:hypothetical protein